MTGIVWQFVGKFSIKVDGQQDYETCVNVEKILVQVFKLMGKLTNVS